MCCSTKRRFCNCAKTNQTILAKENLKLNFSLKFHASSLQISSNLQVGSCICISSFIKVIYKHVTRKIQSTCVKKWSTFSEKKCLRFNIISKINKLLGYYNIKITNGFFGQYLQKGLKQNKRISSWNFTYSN